MSTVSYRELSNVTLRLIQRHKDISVYITEISVSLSRADLGKAMVNPTIALRLIQRYLDATVYDTG